MQHLVKQHHIEAVAGRTIQERQPIGVTQAHLGVVDIGAEQPVAGDRQHVGTDIDADGTLGMRRNQLQHPAGASAGIQEILDRSRREMTRDGRLDLFFGRMQGADALPLLGVGLEIGGGRGGARLAHIRQPGAIGFLQIRIGQGSDGRAQFGAGAPVGGAAEYPAAFLEPLHQSGLAQQLQVARDAGLRLAHDLDQLADRQLSLAQQQQQAQPGGVARGTQHGNQLVQDFVSHISISLYA